MNSSMGRPHLGSRPVDQHSRRFFSGREHETAVLAQWWRNNNLTFASGPAGRGKTSLLLAGVLPLLAQDPLGGTPHILPVGSLSHGLTFPVTALPAHNPYTLSLLRSWAPGESPTKLAGLTIRKFVAGIAGRGTILGAIDPADELAIASGPRERHLRGFLAELKDALRADPRLHLLLVGREQTAAAVEKVLGGTRYEVPPLSWQSAVDAVTGQFRSARRTLTGDAAEKFVTDVCTSPMGAGNATERDPEGLLIEPAVFQVACDQLWESLPADADPVTTQDVQRRTDVDAALAEHASGVLAEVADQQGLSFKRLADWLTESFITELGTENLQYEGAAKTARMPNSVARALEDRHLLVSSQQSGSRWYKLISDRLIEPLRQLSLALPARAAWRPAADLRELLSTAERAFARGDLALAKRLAGAVLTAAGSEQKPVAPRYEESGLAHSLLGNIAYEGGNPSDAEKSYREAVQYFVAAADTKAAGYQLAAIGALLLEQERVADAARELESAVTRVPNDATVSVSYAKALWQSGQDLAAVAVLTAALGIDGNNTAALVARGEILAWLGEAKAALSDLDRAPTADQPATRAARGLALAELGERKQARREIEEAVASGERHGPVLLYAARTAFLLGDETAAEGYARQADYAADPPLSPAQRAAAKKLVRR